MRDQFVDLRLFRYALKAAECGSFRRAAAALGVQQSSVSKGVDDLERRIGVTLFKRNHAGVQATPAGQRFLEEARLGLDHLRRAVQQDSQQQKIVIVTCLPFGVIREVIKRFRRGNPSVLIEVARATSEEGLALVERREADVAFTTQLSEDKALQSLHLADAQLFAVLSVTHPLAHSPEIALGELRTEQFQLSVDGSGPSLASYLREELAQLDQAPAVKLHSVDREDLMEMVACSLGVTVTVGKPGLGGSQDVVRVPIVDAAMATYAIWRKTDANVPTKRLATLLAATASHWR